MNLLVTFLFTMGFRKKYETSSTRLHGGRGDGWRVVFSSGVPLSFEVSVEGLSRDSFTGNHESDDSGFHFG